MKLTKSLEGYEITKVGEGYSRSTLNCYVCRLRILARFLDDPEIEQITAHDLKAFMYWLRTDYQPVRKSGDTSPLVESSMHGYWKAMRSFWNWAAEDFGITNIAKKIKAPVYTNRPIIPFSEDEVKNLIQACGFTAMANTRSRKSYAQKRPTALRDKTIVLVFLDTGIRVGELARLNVSDADLETGQVEIRPFGRGRKTSGRIIYLGKRARRNLWQYLANRDDDNDSLFLNDEGRRLSANAIKSMVRGLGERTGVGAHPHKFRHTFGINYLRNGGDVFTLQRLLGHKSLDMVKRYVNLAQVDAAEAHKRASPVDRWRL